MHGVWIFLVQCRALRAGTVLHLGTTILPYGGSCDGKGK